MTTALHSPVRASKPGKKEPETMRTDFSTLQQVMESAALAAGRAIMTIHSAGAVTGVETKGPVRRGPERSPADDLSTITQEPDEWVVGVSL